MLIFTRVSFFALLILLIAACGKNASSTISTQPDGRASSFTIDSPVEIKAGDDVALIVNTPGLPDNSQVLLVAVTGFGPHTFTSSVIGGTANFNLPAEITQRSGLITLLASSGLHQAEAELQINAGPPASTIPVRVGPNSIVADGQSETTLVAFPVDEWGNPVEDNTPITVQIQHPAVPATDQPGILEVMPTNTSNLLAWTTLKSGTVSGQAQVAVSANQAHSPERTLLEMPGRPATFSLTADRNQIPADGRQLVQLSTSQISDEYGNVMLDGTSVTFLATAADGSRCVIPAHIIDGHAKAVLQAPTQPGSMTIEAALAGVSSRPLTLEFTAGPAVEAIPVAATLTVDTLEIIAGPMVGPLGQLVPDGTPVTFQLTIDDDVKHQLTASTYYGNATATVRRAALDAGAYNITVNAGTGQGQAVIEVD